MAKVGPLRDCFQPPTAHEQLHYLMRDEGEKVLADVLGAAMAITTDEAAATGGGGEVADAHAAAAMAPLAPVLRRLLEQHGGGAQEDVWTSRACMALGLMACLLAVFA